MNILFLTSPEPGRAPFYTNEKRPPIGLGFLMAVLKREGHTVYFEDVYLRPSAILDGDFLQRKNIDVVGVSINSVCFAPARTMLGRLQQMREEGTWRGKIVVGGPHVSVAPHTIPDFVDHLCIGEAEISLPEVLAGEETSRIITGKKVMDLDTLPFPAWEEFIHRPYDWTHDWVSDVPVYTFNTSRGCPFDCTFCSVGAIWEKKYRAMSAARVLDDMERMVRCYGMRVAYFREDHFTLSRKRTVEFCEGLLQRKWDVSWMCETRADCLTDRDVVNFMARSGCKALYIGVESGSPRMLEYFHKGETVEQFEEAFANAREAGIKTYASFVVGAPTETEEDLQQTYQLIERIKPDVTGLNIFVGLPGSELYNLAKREGLYEYEDENGLLYLKGHDARVDRFYRGNRRLKIPRPERPPEPPKPASLFRRGLRRIKRSLLGQK